MSEQEKSIIDDSTLNDSTRIVSRIRFIACVFLATGALAIAVSNAIGETALRGLLLGMLAVMFLLGGGLMGLLATQHFTQTHLPEESASENERKRELLEELRVEQELRRSKGFLGLFAVSSDSRSVR